MARETRKSVRHVSPTTKKNNLKRVFHDTVIDTEDTISDSTIFSDLNKISINDTGYLAGDSNNCEMTINESTQSATSNKSTRASSRRTKESGTRQSGRRKTTKKDNTNVSLEGTHSLTLIETTIKEEPEEEYCGDNNKTEDPSFSFEDGNGVNKLAVDWEPLAESTRIAPKRWNGSSSSRSFIGDFTCSSLCVVEEDSDETLEAEESSISSRVRSKNVTEDVSSLSTISYDSGLSATVILSEGNQDVSEDQTNLSDTLVSTQNFVGTNELYETIKIMYLNLMAMDKTNGRHLDPMDIEYFGVNVKLATRDFLKKYFNA
ncbi:Hypothetical protein SRAE_1000268700 [Strongyloides ratti]|uniref:Uncharacterized protein n=1 Tax=Strongyloides ratti TaxID=34506 RepID=A0A090L8H3_STRRB|nr:Hypothetical protein SRAE_1000268700 [Strongyloides ratti]CEF64433.1 Hypothetical protein SRAE_1000268700 [Strongyloides ratti]